MDVGRSRVDDVHDRDGDRIRGMVDRKYALEVETWINDKPSKSSLNAIRT